MPVIPRPLLERTRGLPPPGALVEKLGAQAGVRRRILQRVTLGWTAFEQQRIEEMGIFAYLDEQLNPETIDDQGLEDALLEALPTLSMSPGELFQNYFEDIQTPLGEFLVATVLRAVYSPRQLFERMVIFWSDHFNIFLYALPGVFLKPVDDRDVIRPHALGSFPDLLRASARSPAMLDYLTNNSNVRDHPNENYARELMELHAMGVDGGYTELDVKEVARCFTGWTYWGYRAGPSFGSFVFAPSQHDFGPKTVLGQQIPGGGGISDAETVLDILAGHPSTARFIATKMLRYMWGYEPPETAIDKVANSYTSSGGDIRSMLWAIFKSADFFEDAPEKLKRPYHLIVSAMRALFAEVNNPFFVIRAAQNAGHMPFAWPPPNGYPDAEGYWSGFLLPRWNFTTGAMTSPEAGVTLDTSLLDPSAPVDQQLALFDQLLLDGTMTQATHDAVRDYLEAAPITGFRLREAASLVLASPEFQRY